MSPGDMASDIPTSQANSLQSDMLGSNRLDSRMTSEVDVSRTNLLAAADGSTTPDAPSVPSGSSASLPPRPKSADGRPSGGLHEQDGGARGLSGVKKTVRGMKKRMVQLASTPRDSAGGGGGEGQA